ncbi:hypothetical protein F511_15501 [Dorcoceras hygrometricum]|uniref:Uncharacterized protein n=1 Tax=Dorcoceras hygrometricum TaxID=472368 RepID=A0A2Z7DER7_9LAMI|nr:hypothetical protein F511_15501 [Dorcoceras hygrometricum]
MRRVVNYHSSWARQQQVELFDASGNPGSTAGRGFNPAGGAPGAGAQLQERCEAASFELVETLRFELLFERSAVGSNACVIKVASFWISRCVVVLSDFARPADELF